MTENELYWIEISVEIAEQLDVMKQRKENGEMETIDDVITRLFENLKSTPKRDGKVRKS